MATIIKRPYGFQLRVSHKLLPKDLWATFDDYETAERTARGLAGTGHHSRRAARARQRESTKSGPCSAALSSTRGTIPFLCPGSLTEAAGVRALSAVLLINVESSDCVRPKSLTFMAIERELLRIILENQAKLP